MKTEVEPTVLKKWRDRKGIPLEAVAKKIGVGEAELRGWESSRNKISTVMLKKIARLYRLSWTAFLLDELPPENKKPINHRRRPNARDFSPETLHAFERARHILEFAAELGKSKASEIAKRFPLKFSENPETLASQVRKYLGVSLGEQSKWRDSRAAKKRWIAILETEGIYVTEMDMPEVEARGFSFDALGRKIIAVSKKDSVNGRIFSLFHELAHLLLGRSGVCDMVDRHVDNLDVDRTEVFCNAFAGAFLLPRESFLQDKLLIDARKIKVFSDELISILSSRYNVSSAVVLRRLHSFGFVSDGEYDRRYKSDQDRYEEDKSRKQKGFARHEYKIINQNGRAFTNEVIAAYGSNVITARDVSNYLDTTVRSIPRIEQALSKWRS